MDFKRIALAAVVTWVADVIYGLVVWMGLLGPEMARHQGVFRSEAAISAGMPLAFAGALLAMFVLVYIYAKGYEGGSGAGEGLRFGFLLALFMTGFVSLPIYASFNIDARLGLLASIASFIEMLFVGAVIGFSYRPVTRPAAHHAGA
ncbi:MAG: hypothetical protein HYU37_11500 [Acidobacteria bacterium]|nr:hypothetical protein [Acidobacteriota bacterium]